MLSWYSTKHQPVSCEILMAILYIKASLCFEWSQQKAVVIFLWIFKITIPDLRKVQVSCVLSPNSL